MKRAELRPNILAQELSDIDGCEREAPFGKIFVKIWFHLNCFLLFFLVGLFGGIIGELVIFFQTLKESNKPNIKGFVNDENIVN